MLETSRKLMNTLGKLVIVTTRYIAWAMFYLRQEDTEKF